MKKRIENMTGDDKKKPASTCAKCVECKYMKEGSCAGLIEYQRQDCPAWYTTRLVPELHGSVLVRSAQGRLL